MTANDSLGATGEVSCGVWNFGLVVGASAVEQAAIVLHRVVAWAPLVGMDELRLRCVLG